MALSTVLGVTPFALCYVVSPCAGAPYSSASSPRWLRADSPCSASAIAPPPAPACSVAAAPSRRQRPAEGCGRDIQDGVGGHDQAMTTEQQGEEPKQVGQESNHRAEMVAESGSPES